MKYLLKIVLWYIIIVLVFIFFEILFHREVDYIKAMIIPFILLFVIIGMKNRNQNK